MSEISRSVMELVYSHLPADGTPVSREVLHDAIELWSPITIKHALRQLKEEGSVVREGGHNNPVFRRVSREK